MEKEKINLNGMDPRDKQELCDRLVLAYLSTSDCVPSDKTLFNKFYQDSGANEILEEYRNRYWELGYDLEYTSDEVFSLFTTIMT